MFLANQYELVGKLPNGRTIIANNYMIINEIRQVSYEGFKMALVKSGEFGKFTNIFVEMNPDMQRLFRTMVKQYRKMFNA